MSNAQILQVVERCVVGDSLRECVTRWIEEMYARQNWIPMLVRGVCEEEILLLLRQLHNAAQALFFSRESLSIQDSEIFYRDWQSYGERVLNDRLGHTLYLSQFSKLEQTKRIELLSMLAQSEVIRNGQLLLIADYPPDPGANERALLAQIFVFTLERPPLYKRGADIDGLICYLSQKIAADEKISGIEGFSLEAITHIHRAILQTSRDTGDLKQFLSAVFRRVADGNLPIQDGYIVAWPIVRMLEDLWQYRIHASHVGYAELVEYDFQERLFSASLEQAACCSGFSQELIAMQCKLLQRMIDESPPHQRSYQGLTSRLDQLLWMGMKIISNARTQAEMRDYFGFGGKGKIPKATTKLKFDQYKLEQYGHRSVDPQSWSVEPDSRESVAHPASTNRVAASTRGINRVNPQESKSPDMPAMLSGTDTSITAAHNGRDTTSMTYTNQLWCDANHPHNLQAEPTIVLSCRPTTAKASANKIIVSTAESESRDILTVEGELAETLFWRHQDLFAVLAADPLSVGQIADLMNVEKERADRDLQQLVEYGLLQLDGEYYKLVGDDIYCLHTRSPLRFFEQNLMRSLHTALAANVPNSLDNIFLRLPTEGLPLLRKELLQPFLQEQLMPLADNRLPVVPEQPYQKQMYTMILLGTHRLAPQIHSRMPLDQRIIYYFRQACLQRADINQREQAICLQASLMLSQTDSSKAFQMVENLNKELRHYSPQGRGSKPNFNLTLCFTKMDLKFYRDQWNLPGTVSGQYAQGV